MQAGGGFQSALALFKRADERAAGLISRASIRHLFRSLGFHDGDVENILQSVGCPQEDPVMYEPLLRWVFGEVAADKSDYSDQISPSQYIGLLREGQSVGLDRLHSLRGRLCRGREPKHFATLGHGMSCFVLGAEGLKLFLDAAARNDGDGAPLEMLLTIGYDILDIYEKLQAGWVFDLVVWKAVDYDPPCATWEGVASTLESVYPVAAEHMRVHLAELQQRGSGVSSPAGYAALQAQHRPEVNGYTFRADASQLKYEDFCALASAGKCSASMVRKFLYDSIGLNDLYAGTGYTILADGSRGITEYIALNMRRGDLQHEATALGAPTVTECLTRISKMYEVLITQSSGLQSFHLSRWLPAEEIPPAGTGRRISPSPKDVADMFRRGERFSPGTVLDGLCCRLQVGKDASWFATTAGQVKWGRKVSLVGASDQILRFLESPRALDCLLLAGLTLSDALFYVKTGRGVQLTICHQGGNPDVFPASFDGVAHLCRQMFPDVVEPLCRHREAVLQPLTEEEFELFESSSINKMSHFAGKEDAYMDYGRFQSSAQGPSEIRQFLYNSLYLRGGWNGSGYERQFIGRRAVAVWISPTINLSDLGADDFATVNLGAPAQDEVIARMCAAIRDLRDVAIATRDVSLE